MTEQPHVLIDLDGNIHDIDSPDFDLEALRQSGLMPEDYELCGTCGFDHEYDHLAWAEIVRRHNEDRDAV